MVDSAAACVRGRGRPRWARTQGEFMLVAWTHPRTPATEGLMRHRACAVVGSAIPSDFRYTRAMSGQRVLFIGDIVGEPGRAAVTATLPGLIEQHAPDFVIANGENVAGGLGITPRTAEKLFAAGIDVLTT